MSLRIANCVLRVGHLRLDRWTKMKITLSMVFGLALILAMGSALADQSLQSALDLSPDQARAVGLIEADFRKSNARARGEYNKEMRAVRRARIANDTAGVAQGEAVAAELRATMQRLRTETDAAIRVKLSAEQQAAFDRHIEIREAMVGSSRDERVYEQSRD